MLTSPSPFSLIAARARRLLDEVDGKIQSGAVATRAGLLVQLLDGIRRFSDTLASPSLEVPVMQADDLLIRENVSRPIAQAAEDVELSHTQVLTSREFIQQVFNVCQAERDGLNEQVAELTAAVDQLRLWISDSDPTFQWVGDTFNDRSQLSSDSTVWVDPKAGTVTLTPIASVSLADRIDAVLILNQHEPNSGLPGNNTEIREPGQVAFTGQNPEPRPRLYGDTSPRTDGLPAILDGSPESWFEWERVFVTHPQPLIAAGRAWVYDPAGRPSTGIPPLPNWNVFVQWPGEEGVDAGTAKTVTTKKKKSGLVGLLGGTTKKSTTVRQGYPLAQFTPPNERDPLTLTLQIALDQARPISWLQLTPLIREGAFPEVSQIWISADGEHWKALLTEPTVLNPRINRGVDFADLGASASNFEGIGVWAFPATPVRYVRLTLTQPHAYATKLGIGHRFYVAKKTKKKRLLGITIGSSTSTNRVQGPIKVIGSTAARLGEGSSVDFSDGEDQTQEQAVELFDVFKADRQVIGIRDLLLEQRSYAAAGQLTSLPFALATPATAVALLAAEQIPHDWPARAPNGLPWISYEISADGQSWQPIVPQVAQLENSVVRFDPPAAQLLLRASFQRPADRPTESPLLLRYALKILS